MNVDHWRKLCALQKRQKARAIEQGLPVPGTGVYRKRRKCRCSMCGGKRYRRPRLGGGQKPLD